MKLAESHVIQLRIAYGGDSTQNNMTWSIHDGSIVTDAEGNWWADR